MVVSNALLGKSSCRMGWTTWLIYHLLALKQIHRLASNAYNLCTCHNHILCQCSKEHYPYLRFMIFSKLTNFIPAIHYKKNALQIFLTAIKMFFWGNFGHKNHIPVRYLTTLYQNKVHKKRNECETLIPVATTSHGLKPEQVWWCDMIWYKRCDMEWYKYCTLIWTPP